MPVSFSPSPSNKAPGSSWNLSPEDLAAQRYVGSLWRAYQVVAVALTAALIGNVRLDLIVRNPSKRAHRLLADTPRKRKKQSQSVPKSLS